MSEWSIDGTAAFLCKISAFSCKYISIEIKGMTLAEYKYINCSVDKLMVQALVINYTTNYSIIIAKTITIIIIIIIIITTATIITTTTITIIISLIIIINLLQTFENRPISGTNIAN